MWLATGDEVRGLSGGYFVDRIERPCQFTSFDAEEALYALVERQTGAEMKIRIDTLSPFANGSRAS